MTQDSRDSIVAIPVWDPPTRAFHWSLALLVALAWASAKLDSMTLHMNAGHAILALIAFRLAWGFVGSRHSRFTDFVRGPRAALAYLRGGVATLGHNPLGGWMVLALLGVLGGQAVTGLFADDDIIASGPLAHLVSSSATSLLTKVHKIGAKAILALIALHLAAVLFHRLVKGENLVRPMITGIKRLPSHHAPPAQPFASPWAALAVFAAAAGVSWGLPPLF
ncbi:MAG: cytochrome b/b6 domain-containing protein [Alphaproteobacteria bacterium]|nr:cytochrome b/b6 domain-containing protein [Alphaproteobacteria bacterium]